MKDLKPYIIRFQGLSLGMHTFSYKLENAFFACFPEGEIQQASVAVDLQMEKSETMVVLNFTFRGNFSTLCDRCLNETVCLVDVKDTVVVKFTTQEQEGQEEGENLWRMDENQDSLDLSQYFYETVVLQRPIQWFCPKDEKGRWTCNSEVLSQLEQMEDIPQKREGSLSEDCLEKLKELKKLKTEV